MKKKKIKLCLTKHVLNMFKLWCEWGISYVFNLVVNTKYLFVYATAFLAAVVILCDTKLARLRGRQRDSLLFLNPGKERFRSKASTTISVGSQFSSENHKLALTFVEL